MVTSRRRLLALTPALLLLPRASRADADPHMAERAVGDPKAPVTVTEFYSLTCPHCARFAASTYVEVEKQLIATGKLRYVFADYPLDKSALLASQVARYLPPERYEPFAMALLSSQQRWAYARDADPKVELARMASLAGLSHAQFEAAAADTGLRDAILAEQDAATQRYGVDSTPTFIFNGPKARDRKESGELSYAEFAKVVGEVAGSTTG